MLNYSFEINIFFKIQIVFTYICPSSFSILFFNLNLEHPFPLKLLLCFHICLLLLFSDAWYVITSIVKVQLFTMT